MVNPDSTDADPSPLLNVTTLANAVGSMVVTAAPPLLVTVIFLPRKVMFSAYVPGSTSTTSPLTAALMAAWMVGKSAGT